MISSYPASNPSLRAIIRGSIVSVNNCGARGGGLFAQDLRIVVTGSSFSSNSGGLLPGRNRCCVQGFWPAYHLARLLSTLSNSRAQCHFAARCHRRPWRRWQRWSHLLPGLQGRLFEGSMNIGVMLQRRD